MPKRLFKLLSVIAGLFLATVVYGVQTNQFVVLSEAERNEGPGERSFASSDSVQDDEVASHVATTTNALVIRATDGDTLVVRLDGETEERRVRMLGINTPETVDPRKPVECFGKEASARMHELVDGKRVLLAEDPQADEHDKYDRILRNVFLADGTDVNAAMVRDGYAYAYLSFPLDPLRKRELKLLQEDAKLARRGLWNPNTCTGNP